MGSLSNKKVEDNGKKSGSSNFLTNILIVFLVGVLLIVVGSMFTPEKPAKSNVNGAKSVASVGDEINKDTVAEDDGSSVAQEYKDKMEKELITILEKIDGVGKVHAMIYFESGKQQVPVFNENKSSSVTNETDTSGGQREITTTNDGSTVVMENNGEDEKPYIVKTYNPSITGICVVAEGAGESVTEMRIRQAVTRLFDLEDSKVQVYPMKK